MINCLTLLFSIPIQFELTRLHQLLKTSCVKGKGTKIILINSIAQNRTESIHILVDCYSTEIRNNKHDSIPFQINPLFKDTNAVKSNEFEIVFLAHLPPLGIETYTIHKVKMLENGSLETVTAFNFEQEIPEELGF